MLAKIRNTFLASVVAFTGAFPAHASAIHGEEGQVFYRYKDVVLVATPPVTEAKDVVAYFIGGVGFPFSELLPLKTEWQDDTWSVEEGTLPDGITFNSGTRRFEGSPTSAAKGTVVYMRGVDKNGNEVADAKVTFDVYDIVGQPVKADIYAHTGKYKLDELAIPRGLTVDSWERVVQYSPPPGITVNGPYFEGTPTSAGHWQYMIYGKNYMGEIVVTFWGKYIVEDGPSFNQIADMVYPLPQNRSISFDFGAPSPYSIVRAIDPKKPVRYFLEVDPSTPALPGTVASNDDAKNLRIKGQVSDPYQTALVRFRAVDSDGTTGQPSNWFRFGSSDPQPTCDGNGERISFAVYTGTAASVRIPNPQGGQGVLEYHLSAGTLPVGLTLDKNTGLISGTPTKAGEDQDVSVRIDVINGSNTVSAACSYNIVVKAGNLTVADATDPQAKHVRTGDAYTGTAHISGGIPPYGLTFSDPAAFPTLGFTSPTQDMPDVTVSGIIQTAGQHSVGLTLSNGDGTTKSGNLTVTAHDELDVGPVPTVRIKRLAKAQDWASVPYDANTVIPDVRLGDQPKFTLTGTLPSDIAFTPDGVFAGATSAAAKSYGMFTATISDYSGDSKATQPFEVIVDPRDEIAPENVVPPTFTVEWDVDQMATPATFKQPEGAKNFAVKYELVNLSSDSVPTWLTIDENTGAMTASANIPFADKGTYGPYAVKATDVENSTATSDPFEVNIKDWDDPSATVTTSWKGTVSGNTTIGEDATWLDIPGAKAATLSNFIDVNTVIGGRAGVTYTGSTPSNPAGIGGINSAGMFSGRPTEEFNGNIAVNFEDSKGRKGTMQLPLEVRPYPTVRMDQNEYELPRLSRAETLGVKIQGKKVNGFWNDPVWTLDTTKGNPLPSHPDDDPAEKLYVDSSSGVIRGFTKAAVGTRVDNIVLKATSLGANAGERFESWTAPFSIVITKPDTMGLTYDKSRVVYYLVDDGNGGLQMSSSNPTVSPVAKVSGSYEAPLIYSLKTADAVAAGMTGTLDINPDTGNLKGFPTVLGEWTVYANVSDKYGLTNSPADVPLTIKATLDGNIGRKDGGGTFKLRQDQKFTTADLGVFNAVGDVVFSSNPISSAPLDFDLLTGVFRYSSHFASPVSNFIVRVDGQDEDGRTFGTGYPVYVFNVEAPLTATASIADIVAKQYAAPGAGDIDVSFPIQIDHKIGKISYALEGDLPGTLVNRVYDDNGNFLSWNWTDEDGASHSLPAATANPLDQLPVDALVFDPKNPSLKGSPSREGVFAGLKIKATDSHISAYEVDEAGLDVSANRTAYNTASVGPFSITVETAAPLIVANSAASETLYQYTSTPTLRTTVQNAAYGKAITQENWTMVSGDLPDGVTAVKGASAVTYTGYPEVKGSFNNIVWRVRDAAGRSMSSNAASFVVEERKGLEIAASPNPFGVVEGTALPSFAVTARNAAYGKAIPAEDWTLPASGLPAGIDMSVASGRVGLSGTSDAVGDYNVTVSAIDSLGSPASTSVSISVLDEDELIKVSSTSATTKKGIPVEIQVTPTSRTFGTLSYATTDPAVSVNAAGLATATYAEAGSQTAIVTVSDATRRSTEHEIAVEVIDELKIEAPATVYAEIGASRPKAVIVTNVLGTASFVKGTGTWPAGLDVDPATGEITGVVTAAAGEYSGLTVRGTDTYVSGGKTYTEIRDSNAFTVLVDGKPTGFELATPVSPEAIAALVANTGIEGFAITPVNAAWDLPIPVGKWTVDVSRGLPPGVAVTAENNRVVVTGTPTLLGAYGPIRVTATDGLGQQATADLTLRVIEPTDEIALTVPEVVTTKVNVPISIQATAANTYGKVHFYSYDIDGEPRNKTPGQYANDLDIDINTGLVTGSFATLGDRDFDVWVTDATKRVTSRPTKISVIPNLRVTVPAQVAAQQAVKLDRTVDTAYKIGTVAYAKGAGSWPVGVEVDPLTGSIFSKFVDPVTGAVTDKVQSAAGTYSGLTITAVDTFVFNGVTFTDSQSSNTFAIVVDLADVVPDIADQQKTILGTQDTAITSWYPKAPSGWAKGVVESGQPTQGWNYAGTTYKLSHDLTQYGLSFDKNTGIISGTAHTPFIVRDMVMTVTSQRGDSDSTAPFWIGVAPKYDMVVNAAQKTHYKWRMNSAFASDAVAVDNVIGNLTFSKPNTILDWAGATGVLSYPAWNTSSWVKKGVAYATKITDEFNRNITWNWTADFLNDLVVSSTEKVVSPQETFANSTVATVTASGIYGTLSYTMVGLPDGLSYNSQTGVVSGTLDAKYKDGDLIPVTVTVADSYDGAVRTSTFNYRIKDGYLYYRLNDSVTPDGNTWGGVYWGEMKLRNAAGVDLAAGGTSNSAVSALISSPNVYPTVSASNPPRVFDGQTVTGMLFGRDGLGVRYIGVKFKEPQVIAQVWISLPKPTTQADFDWLNTYYPAVPVNFKIEASNDGVSWTTLKTDSFTGVGGGSQRTQWDATYNF